MTVIRCPACDAPNNSAQEDVWLFKRLRCDACGVLMEIVTEHPLTAEWVPENWSNSDWVLYDCTYNEPVEMAHSTGRQKATRKSDMRQREWR